MFDDNLFLEALHDTIKDYFDDSTIKKEYKIQLVKILLSCVEDYL